MKQLLLGTIGVLSLGSAAIAADVPARAYTKAPAVDPAYNWTGFYAGVHAGYGLGSTEWQILNIRTDGALGGIQAGYNQQIGNLLLGIEADISFSGLKGNRTLSVLNQATLTQTSQINWLSTVTGRVGFANGRWLTYAKGGFAWANEDHGYDVQVSAPGPDRITLSGSETRRGWVVGAGTEYALANNWSLRGEYNFIKFPGHDFDFNGTRLYRTGFFDRLNHADGASREARRQLPVRRSERGEAYPAAAVHTGQLQLDRPLSRRTGRLRIGARQLA